MLSEGIAQFGALRTVEEIEGSKAAERFRKFGYKTNSKHSAVGYFRLALDGKDLPITSYEPKNQGEIINMHRLTNSKGFIIFDMLYRRIGDDKFSDILKNFIRENSERKISWQDFQTAIEVGADEGIRWFFEQWLERTGAPDFQLSWQQTDSRLIGSIDQPSPYFRTSMEIQVKGENQSLWKTIEITGEQTTFQFNVPFKADSVLIDPHYKILHWTPDIRAQLDSLP